MARALARRVGRIALYGVLSIVGLAIGLVTLVFAALAIPPLRNYAVDQGVAYANQSLDGMQVKVKSVDRIDPWGLNVRGIQLFDEQARELVNVRWVRVRLRPLALLRNTLALTEVQVDDVRAQLYPSDTPEPEEPEEPPSEPSSFTIRADHVRIRGAQLTTPFQGRTLKVMIGTLAAGGQYGPKPALALEEARVRVTADDDVLLQLRTTEGAWRAERGGKVGVAAQLAGAPLSLEAELPPLEEVEPWPLHRAALRLRGLDRRGLELLGVPDGAELEAPLDLAVDAQSQDDRLTITATLRAGQGAVDLVATADEQAYELSVALAPAQLSRVAGILPDLKAEGNVHVRAWPTHLTDSTPERLVVEWNHVAIDDGAVPAGVLRAELPLPVVRLNSLTLAGLEDALAVRGEFDTERSRGRAAIDFRELDLGAIEALRRQGVAGQLDGGLTASFSPSTVAANGKLDVRGFAHPSAAFSALALELRVSGRTIAPEGRFTLRVDQLRAGELKLDQVSSEIEATLERLSGRLQVRGPDTLLNAELGGQRTPRGELRAQAIGRGKLASKDLRFDLRELLYGEKGLTVQELSLFSGKQALRMSGALDSEQQLQAALVLSGIDLAEWAALAKIEGLSGRLDADIKLAGSTEAPRVDGKIELTKAQYRAELPLNATLQLKGDLGTRKAEAQLAAYSDRELGARITAAVALPKRPRDFGRAAERAKIALDASVYMPVEQISAIAGDQLVGLAGMLEAKVHADGTLDEPTLDADITARLKLPERQEQPSEAIRVTANATKDEGRVSVWAKDELGELLTLNGQLVWPGGSPRAALEQPAAWQNARFHADAHLRSRRFDTMQGVFAYFSKLYALSLPLRASAELSLDGQQGQLEGAAKLAVVLFGDKLDGRCQLGAQSAVDLELQLKRDQVEGALTARTDGGGSIRGKLESHLALNALNGGEPVIGPATLTLEGQEIALHKLPGLCNLAGGRANFTVGAKGFGKQRPELDVKASVRDLRAHDQPPLDVETTARAAGASAELRAQLTSKQRSVGSIEAKLPLSYPDGTTPTVLPDAPLKAHVRLDKLLLANVLAFTQSLGRVSGTASADLRVGGKLNDPYPEGYVQLENVNLSIASLAQPFRDIEGRFEIRGRSAKIPKLTARDRDGKLSLEGFASLRQDFSGEGGLYLEADKFPLRQQGTVIGELTTRARVDVKVPTDLKLQAQLKILDGTIWLTGERGKRVQSMDPHPDLRFADEKVEQDSTPAEETAEGGGVSLGVFKMKTERELWLNHKEFALQVGVDITLAGGENGPTLEGEATLKRGELKLLGKPFKLQKGAVRFTGPIPPDPELDIKAVYKPPAGEDLIVQVSGRGSSPILSFSGAASTAGEAVAVLTGVGASSASKSGAESQASADMAGIAADLTAGLLVMSARREFGDWVPMLSIETGESGKPTAARAGFDASKLIPPWLSGFARGAYVEGIIGQGSERGGSVGVGVELEVALPRDFITTLGYGPGPGWFTDVTWSP